MVAESLTCLKNGRGAKQEEVARNQVTDQKQGTIIYMKSGRDRGILLKNPPSAAIEVIARAPLLGVRVLTLSLAINLLFAPLVILMIQVRIVRVGKKLCGEGIAAKVLINMITTDVSTTENSFN